MPNYLQLAHTPNETFCFRLTDHITNLLDRFQDGNVKRTEKISYLVRLVKAVDPEIIIEPHHKEPKKRHHLSGSYLPEDVVGFIRSTALKYELKIVAALDLLIMKGLELSKKYALEVKVTYHAK